MEQLISFKYIINAIVFSALGIVVLSLSFVTFDRATPGNLWKEIVEEQNIALAILMGTFILGIAQIIASAIHG